MALDEAQAPPSDWRTHDVVSDAAQRPSEWRWVWALLALAAVVVCVLPAAAVILGALVAVFQHGAPDAGLLMGEAAWGTVSLVFVGAGLSTLIGGGAGWLVSAYTFPGRALWSWLLVLPLAAPAYVLAYAYGGLTGPLGPAPIALSGWTGALLVYVLGFYPYAFLAARSAFAMQSVCALEAARAAGASPMQAWWRVSAPLAWPVIAAGGALAAMEIAADYGAASYFGVQTLSTGVFRAWHAYANPQLALQIAALLLIGAMALLMAERALRGKRGFSGSTLRWRDNPPTRLRGFAAVAATLFCALLFMLALALPVGWLVRLAVFAPPDQLDRLAAPLTNTLMLAAAGAFATLAVASIIAFASKRRHGGLAVTAASAGYAAPGAVMALGGLMAAGLAREWGLIGGFGGGLAIAMLIWIYAARFAAAGAGPIEAGLHAVKPSITHAARSLGARGFRRIRDIEAPIVAPALLGAALIVFVEILKELPATLILRPFDFDTLAVVAHAYAADDRLNAAALPALLILAAGIAPTIALTRQMLRARAGARP